MMKRYQHILYSAIVLTLLLIIYLLFLLHQKTIHNYYSDSDNSPDYYHDPLLDIREFASKQPHYHHSLSKEEQSLSDQSELTKDGSYDYQNASSSEQNLSSQSLLSHFSKCHMSTCFNFNRCPPNTSMTVGISPSIIQDKHSTETSKSFLYKNILSLIRNSTYYESDYTKACILVPEDDTLDRDPLSTSFISDLQNLIGLHNNYGTNHLIFNLYAGTWPDYKENDFAGLIIGAAILAKASNSIIHHREGFDVSLPLFSENHPLESNSDEIFKKTDAENMNRHRPVFLSFKGKRYITGHSIETRNRMYHIDNDRDIFMMTTCKHGKQWKQKQDDRCISDETRYDSLEYFSLMQNSTFCLIPRGRRLGSYRHLEAMSYGCIPVILSDGWIKPFEETIDWPSATIHYKEQLLLFVPEMLRDISDETIARMRSHNLKLYRKYFSSIRQITLTTLAIIEERIDDHYHKQVY